MTVNKDMLESQQVPESEKPKHKTKTDEDQSDAMSGGVLADFLIQFDRAAGRSPRIILSVLAFVLIVPAIALKMLSAFSFVSNLSSVEFVLLIAVGVALSLLAAYLGDKSSGQMRESFTGASQKIRAVKGEILKLGETQIDTDG